jgi:hypothetical protein
MKRMRVVSIVLLVSMFLVAAVPGQTTNPSIDHMEIDIWPEYDRHSVLVIFRFSLTSFTSFPTRVSMRIPATAGEPYSVAMKDIDGLLYNLEYTLTPDGIWNKLEFVTSGQNLQIEFYDPYDQLPNSNHAYEFKWISDFSVNNLTMNIQKPKHATEMTIKPDPGPATANLDDGLMYYKLNLGLVGQGTSISVNINYLKINDSLSASIIPVNPVTPLPTKRTIWQVIVSIFPYIWQKKSLMIASGLLFGGVILLNVLFAFIWKPKVGLINSPAKKGRKVSQKSQKQSDGDSEIYCYHCGKRARSGDIFCRTCGSRLME